MAALHLSTRRVPIITTAIRYWNGEGPLWRIYWIYGVATSCVLAAIYAAALVNGVLWLQQVMIPVFVAYTLWIVVSVWRCAPNAEKELYTVLARWLTVAWSLNTLLLAVFLQLRLIGLFVG